MVDLKRAVGRGVDNPLKSDVRLVQKRLNLHRPGALPPIDEDGALGDETCAAIEEFQARVMKMKCPDGRVDPGGRTWTALLQPADEPGAVLRASDAARALLRQLESLWLFTYDDQTGLPTYVWVKGATIGYGHLISKSEWPRFAAGIDEAGAEALLDRDLLPFEAAVRATITAPVSQQQFDALTLLAFNIGAANLTRSSVAKMLNDPAAKTGYRCLEDAWKSWSKSQGKVMLGLQRRRQCEWDVYSKAIYMKGW